MTEQKQYKRSEVEAVVKRWNGWLMFPCERFEFVGSYRRKKEFLHDLDVILIPKLKAEKHSDDQGDLFGGATHEITVSKFDKRLGELEDAHRIKGVSDGPKIKRIVDLDSGIPMEFYIASEETWSILRLIRTGSKEHNTMLAKRAKSMGMKLKAGGEGLIGRKGLQLPIIGESDYFSHLGLDYVKPENREV